MFKWAKRAKSRVCLPVRSDVAQSLDSNQGQGHHVEVNVGKRHELEFAYYQRIVSNHEPIKDRIRIVIIGGIRIDRLHNEPN